jgi:hypothetical protein
MEIKVYTVKLNPPHWLRNVIVYGLLPAGVLLGGALAVHAAVSITTFQPNTAISSDAVNKNFAALKAAVENLQHAPTVSTALSPGSATASGAFANGIYTTPPKVAWLEIEMVGGGGAGGPSGGSSAGPYGSTGGAGGSTTFGGTMLVAGGGGGGTNACANGAGMGVGGTPSVTASSSVLPVKALYGGTGGAPPNISAASWQQGGPGGASTLGGSGGGSGASNTGSGGAGAPTNTGAALCTGHGGGAGAYVHAIVIPTPGQVFAYSVGTAGQPGTAGSGGAVGSPGGTGAIFVTEHY